MSEILLFQTFFSYLCKNNLNMIIDKIKLYELYTDYYYTGSDYKFIQDTILFSDSEDGGAHHEAIIQDLSTGKYYKGYYCDWDIEYNFEYDEETGEVYRCDFNNDLQEVFPKQVTTTKFE